MGTVTVRVAPRSGRRRVEAGSDERITVRVRAAPEGGQATEEARQALAEAIGVPASRVSLLLGVRSRTKVFQVAGVTEEEIAMRLGATRARPVAGPGRGCYRPSAMAGRANYTKKELDDLRKRLLDEKAELEDQLTTIEETSFATSQSDLSGEVSFDEENADAGTFTFERERDLSIENNVRDLLGKIDRAIARMDDGTYGACSRCGKPIEKARMKALPYVDLCIKDAQAQTRSR